ncbi:MAG: type II toxin-antitoxin system RelE/ParE family toxin [Candidatus Rokubacteria bacterium]|nr:type II toxin-antitoxin system RelE/ParE family toxin [Candidatus Rokubacteria bacterium]
MRSQTALRIVDGCERLKSNPFPDGKHVKKLKGYEELYRLPVGDLRVVFQRSGSRIEVIDVLSKPDFQKAY